jgi:hypothetical protein
MNQDEREHIICEAGGSSMPTFVQRSFRENTIQSRSSRTFWWQCLVVHAAILLSLVGAALWMTTTVGLSDQIMIANSSSSSNHRRLLSHLFLPSKCPSAASLQSANVVSNFNASTMQGFYYELAYQDLTQPRFCKCQTANKTLSRDQTVLFDNFEIQCVGAVYPNNLTFELEQHRRH